MLDAATRAALREAIDRATRAGLRPANRDARPGFIPRSLGIATVTNTGREVRRPTLSYYDNLPPEKPRILRALNG